MSNNSDFEQNWWHVEDQLKPAKCRLFRPVMDFYTKKIHHLNINTIKYIIPLQLKWLRNNEGDLLGRSDRKKRDD